MSRYGDGDRKPKVSRAVLKGIFRLLISNPPLLAIIIIVIIGIVAYTLYSIDYQLTQIMKQYQSLSARALDSKAGFDKKLFYVTTDENGQSVIHVGYRSEEEEQQAKEDLDNAGGGNDTPGGYYNFTATDEEMLALFKEIGASERKAYGLLACYNAATDCGMTPKQTLGLLGCAMCEGYPGLVQYSFPKNLGTTGSLFQSSNKNPLIIDTQVRLDALIGVQHNKDNMGIGTAQWTNGRCAVYLQLMKDMYGGQTNISNDDLYILDYTMYKNELTGSYKSLVSGISDHDDSLEAILCFSWAKYEAGFGNYNGDSISAYTGVWLQQLNNRYPNVIALDAKFQERFGD